MEQRIGIGLTTRLQQKSTGEAKEIGKVFGWRCANVAPLSLNMRHMAEQEFRAVVDKQTPPASLPTA
jgi:hypothetical protein